MDIFINTEKRQYLKLNIYYCQYSVNSQDNLLFFHKKELANDLIRDKLKKLEAKFLVPTFEEYINIQKKSVFQSGSGEAIIHDSSYKQNILKSLLKKIITDDYELVINEEGKDENYGDLHPLLGDALFKAFESAFLNPEVKIDEIF